VSQNERNIKFILMEKDEKVIGKKVTLEGSDKSPAVEKTETTVMAGAAPETDEPTPETPETDVDASEAPDKEDISDLINLLNEINQIDGGGDNISDVPEELRGVLKFITGKLLALRDAFEDPLFKKVLDDMVDQREDGQTPSLLVAVARNVPIEELQELADGEGYEEAQGAVEEKVASDKQAKADEEGLYANFEKSDENLKAYCEKMGYEGEEKDEFFGAISMLRDAFADGILSMEELEQIDKMRNYDKDVEGLRSQIPEEPSKEVLPDKASIDAAMTPPTPKRQAPSNSIEAMAAINPMTDVTMIGKRKRHAGGGGGGR